MEILFIFLLGLATGSFLNVLIDRLPKNKSILGRSQCDHCRRKLKTLDLIPVFSYLFLAGRCRYCKKRLSWQYPLVELLTGALFVIIWIFVPVNEVLKLFYLGLFSCLIVIFFTDWKYRIIPDQINITLFLFSLAIIYFGGFFSPNNLLIRLRDGLIVMLPIFGLYLVTKGKGMGFADVKLSFIIGFFLQILSGFYAIYFAFVSGAIFGVFLIFLKKKKMKDVIAFGPFLALGLAIMIFFGNAIVEFVKKFYF